MSHVHASIWLVSGTKCVLSVFKFGCRLTKQENIYQDFFLCVSRWRCIEIWLFFFSQGSLHLKSVAHKNELFGFWMFSSGSICAGFVICYFCYFFPVAFKVLNSIKMCKHQVNVRTFQSLYENGFVWKGSSRIYIFIYFLYNWIHTNIKIWSSRGFVVCGTQKGVTFPIKGALILRDVGHLVQSISVTL